MSKYSDKKKRQAEEAARSAELEAKVESAVAKKVASVVSNFKARCAKERDAKIERDRQWRLSVERRAAKYNAKREAARNARRNNSASILTNAELIALSHETEKAVKRRYADVIAELRNRLVVALAMNNEIGSVVSRAILTKQVGGPCGSAESTNGEREAVATA